MPAMEEIGYFVGQGGGKPWRMDLPLPEVMRDQVTKGYLVRVNEDGSPYTAPAAEAVDEDLGDGDPPSPVVEPPAPSALKAEWVGYAVRAHGVSPDDAEAMTKADLIEKYGPKPVE